MRIAHLFVVLLMLALIYQEAEARSKSRKQFKDKKLRRTGVAAAVAKSRTAQRKSLIQCCGKVSCSKIALKKKSPINIKNSINIKRANSTPATKNTPVILEIEENSTLDETNTDGGPKSPQEVLIAGPVENQTSAEGSTLQSKGENTNMDFHSSKISTAVSTELTSAGNMVSASPAKMSSDTIEASSSESTEKSITSSSSINAKSAIAISGSTTAASSAAMAFSTEKMAESQSTINKAYAETTPTTTKAAAGVSDLSSKTTPPLVESTTFSTVTHTINGDGTTTSSAKTTIPVANTENTTVAPEISTTTASPTISSTTTSNITTTPPRTKGYTTVTTSAPKVLPSCPSTCMKDQSLFRIDGTHLDEPSSHGFWEFACGELYIFGKSIANWEQNIQKCCSIGMTPIIIDSKEKSECFDKFIDGVKWKYNSRYWSSGLRSSATEFKWCNSSAPVDSALWVKNEPDNLNDTENCAQLVISKTNSSARLEDKHCGKITAFACQGPTTPKPPCEAPTCPNVTCQKNKIFYTMLRDERTSYLTNPSQHGYFVPFDDRTFVFSFQNDTRTFEEAYTACCSIGMKLLSLHQAHKYKSIMGALKSAKLEAAEFWTSGTDSGCERSYGYCSSTRLLREEAKWDMAQPNNLNGNEHCLSINLQHNTALLRDEKCEDKKRYICEARQASGAKVIETECGSVFNLTAEQIKKVMLSMPVLLEEKCFLKCFGEGTDMFINGRLVEDKIFAQFTSVSAGDMGKLMEMYSTMNFCATGTRGMDACDKVSQLLKCGKENSPELLTGVMNNLENMIKEAPLVLPPTKGVCPEFTCVIDDAFKTVFENTAHHITIWESTFTGHVTHACNKKYIFTHPHVPVTLEQAMEFCCKFGLRLLTVATQAQLQCLTQNTAYGPYGAAQKFLVAASRLGNLPNPKWCFSDTPFYPTVATDYVVTNTDPLSFLLVHSFDATNPYIISYSSPFSHFACESIN